MSVVAESADAIAALVELGFTALEAEVYTWLLGEPAATGYRIAQGIGKPVANTYKAIESLQNKGAILVEEEENRLCRAVPADELLRALDRGFAARRAQAARSLAGMARPEGDDRVYTLRTPEQVLERARTMLAGARRVALVDAFPRALDAVGAAVVKAAARGVTAAVKAYAPARLGDAEVYVQPQAERTIARWPGEWLNLVVDGAEHLLAFLARDLGAVRQAIWSRSPYLSWVYHSALGSELVMAEVLAMAATAPRGDPLRKVAARADALVVPDAPGYKALVKRFAKGESS
jgi:HTH-type transcriptional regulator, sugar sensing transcriptional regulator